MKFLLFFVSICFSLIFYIFSNFAKWRDLLGNKINNSIDLVWISPNLLIESFIFFLIGIIFLYIFSKSKSTSQSTLLTYKLEISYFIFYVLLIFYLYFFNKWFDNYLLIIMLFFILSDILFNYISNISYFLKKKIYLKYVWLILNYISSFSAIYYIFINWVDYILLFILIFNIIFNILIHKRYTNYISLFVSIGTIIFLLFNLYFFIFKLYINI